MKSFLVIIFLTGLIFSQSNENRSFKLIDGTVIVGSIQEETETTYIIVTKYGSVTLSKDELVQTEYQINLKSGETFSGIKLSETDTSIQLKTKVGVLNIEKTDILDMKESGQVNQSGEKKAGSTTTSHRSAYSLSDFLFGTGTRGSSKKDVEFSLGEERLTDTFFDPTAYVLDEGTLYLSGLSFGFGVSEKLTIFSKWVNYFWGDFNIAPKYMIFQKGNWEKESALAIGGHFHTYWKPDKVVWQQGTTTFPQTRKYYRDEDGVESPYWSDYSDEHVTEDTTFIKYYGGYIPIGAKISGGTIYRWNNDWDFDGYNADVNETDDFDYMVELNIAYTFSKARKGMRGRVSNTLGALVQAPMEGDWPYRIFWGADVDITPKLKMVGEVFYDKFFLDIINTDGPFDLYTYKVSKEEVTEDDFKSVRPIHFDFGFIYAINENFRFGLHSQPYIITFYWKF